MSHGTRPAIRSASVPTPPGGHHRSRLTCQICNGPLTVHEEVRGRVCGSPRCKRTAILRAAAERARAAAEAVRWRALAWRDAVRASLGISAMPVALAVLPANRRRLVTLPARRRRAFEARLAELVSEAVGTCGAPASGEPQPDRTFEDVMLAAACATCRGHCCGSGGEHAYLDATTIRRYMQHNDVRQPAQVFAAYSGKLPTASYQNSCVFHARHGCALPRAMRSSICNDFLCRGLLDFRAELTKGGAEQLAFATATRDGQLLRARLFDQRRVWRQLRARR